MKGKFPLINRIRYRSLISTLEENKFFQISFQSFHHRFCTKNYDYQAIANSIFHDHENYELLGALKNAEEYMKDTDIFINLFADKKLFLSRKEYYSEIEYKAVFQMSNIVLDKEHLKQLINIANGL